MSHERLARRGVIAGLVGLLCLLAVSVGSVLWVYTNLQNFRETAYMRCLDRVELDTAAREARLVQVREWTRLANSESHNPFVDDQLRRQRVTAYRQMAEVTQTAADARVRGDCSGYKP